MNREKQIRARGWGSNINPHSYTFDYEASQMVAISNTCSLSAAQLCRCTEAVSYLLADCCRCTSIVWNSRERKLSSLLLTRVQKPLLVGMRRR
jgi:hypothetical protein